MRRPACELRRSSDGPCDGPAVVQIEDRTGQRAWGCLRHAATALRAIERARLVSGAYPGAMIEAYQRARRGRR